MPVSVLSRRVRALSCAVGGCAFALSRPTHARCDPLPRSLHVSSGREGTATAAAAILLNTAVFFAWQAPSARLRAFMEAWFVSSAGPQRAALAPSNIARALLSSMSHRSLLHLACNMAGVASFSPLVIDGAESIARPKLAPAEYGALWAASGTASALASSAFSARYGSGAGGLGASGFLFSLLTFHALASPDSRVLLFFVFECSMRDGLGLATVANFLLAAKEVLASRGIGKPPVVDGVAHLVGTALGVAAFSWARERARRRRRERKAARAAPTVSIQKPPGNSARV